MKTIFKTAIILSLIFFQMAEMKAQNVTETQLKSSHTKLALPSLKVIIDSAIAHNGMLNYRKLEIDAKDCNLKSKRQYWTRNFGVQADTGYGTFNNLSSINGDNSTVNLASNTQQVNYNVGLYLKIPVFDVINRKSQIKQAKSELEQAKSLAKSQEDELREIVIRSYEELLLKENVLALRASNLGNAKVNMEMVEKEFRNGLIPISEYVRISDMTSRIAAEFEQAKSEFLVSKRLLENLAGFEIN
ncbi:TolC family protein [Flavobacterium sp. CYK-4]|uniref:TolC family protein n=1 Tax=Flavobacterium lotistagni TaxID=2709660 RepID=UPI00140A6130|nr:TolC family protein [Flavobacterium lotistagni]NHM07409.1 TolC family protein [Flavobacterium lotistagni]